MSRLETIAPDLQDRVISLDSTRQDGLAIAVSELVANRAGIDTLPDVAAILRQAQSFEFQPESIRSLEQLVEHLDEVAWDFQDQGDETSYGRAFEQARAANAVLNLAQLSGQERTLDVCYEAYAAIGSTADLSRLVDEAVGS